MHATEKFTVLTTDEYQHRGLRRGMLFEILEDRSDTYYLSDGTVGGQTSLPKVVCSEPEDFAHAFQRAQDIG